MTNRVSPIGYPRGTRERRAFALCRRQSMESRMLPLAVTVSVSIFTIIVILLIIVAVLLLFRGGGRRI